MTTCGRIESYIHSDATIPHKGGALVRVTCDTDFAARTPEFCQFVQLVAKLAFASSATCWFDICATYPEMEVRLAEVQAVLREKVSVVRIIVMQL